MRDVRIWSIALTVALLATYFGFDESSFRSAEYAPPGRIAKDDLGEQVWALAFSPQSTKLAATTIIGDVWLKDLRSGNVTRIGRELASSVRTVAFSPDGERLIVGGIDSIIRMWDVETGAQLEPLEVGEPALHIAVSARASLLAVGSTCHDDVALWDWAQRKRIAVLEGRGANISAVSFSPDGTRLAAVDRAAQLTVWNLRDRRQQLHVPIASIRSSTVALEFCADQQKLATLDLGDGYARFWDLDTGACLGTTAPSGRWNWGMAVWPGGVALASSDGRARLSTSTNPGSATEVACSTESLYSIAASPNGRYLATGGRDGAMELWALDRLLPSAKVRGRCGNVRSGNSGQNASSAQRP